MVDLTCWIPILDTSLLVGKNYNFIRALGSWIAPCQSMHLWFLLLNYHILARNMTRPQMFYLSFFQFLWSTAFPHSLSWNSEMSTPQIPPVLFFQVMGTPGEDLFQRNPLLAGKPSDGWPCSSCCYGYRSSNSSKSNDHHKLGRSGVNMCEFSHMPSAFLAKSSCPFGVLLSLVYFFPENYAP